MTEFTIRTKEDLERAVEELGFLPYFSHGIKGFSIEEHVDPKAWFSEEEGIWEWKGPVIRDIRAAYGKFFDKKAGFISKKWFPDFANMRRDGYDFEAGMSDGLFTENEEYLYHLIASHKGILSRTAKAYGGYLKTHETGKDRWEPRKGFDTTIAKLQKRGYILISDFEYEIDKKGEFYGWGIAEYMTPERFYGKSFEKNVYKRTPEESKARIRRHLKKILPGVDEIALERFLER